MQVAKPDDVSVILVSTNLLWNASVELRKKLALTGIFCLTLVIICDSIIRIVLITGGARLDLTWLLLWSGLEMTVGTVSHSIPSFSVSITKLIEQTSSNCRRLRRLLQNSIHKV